MEDQKSALEDIVQEMSAIGAICFGEFTLKSGLQSPIYIDLRTTMGKPKLLMKIAAAMWRAVQMVDIRVEVVCGVPTGAIPLAMCVAIHSDLPLILCRKEVKDYGRKRSVEGQYQVGQRCIVVEDVFVSGQSTMETIAVLRDAGLDVTDAVVFLDRQQGGKEILEAEGVKVHSAITFSVMLKILHSTGMIDNATNDQCKEFIVANRLTALPRHVSTAHKPKRLGYHSRAELCKHPLAKRLFKIMDTKRTNLALSADVTTCDELIKIADELGPHLCILKTHVDFLEDFQIEKMQVLEKLAKQHSFLIFEDRKFADIGNTVRLQYEGGTYRIAQWAHLINAHPLPGPGVIQGLKNVKTEKDHACILVAEMSSVDHLCTKDYVQKTVELANRNKDFIIGFICQSYLTSNPEMIHMVPGVRLERGNDGLGQGYITPDEAFQRGADLIIVGRGILQSTDQKAMAKRYQMAGYDAYLKLVDDA